MKRRVLAYLLTLSLLLTGLGFTPVQAAGDGPVITEVEPQMDPNRWNAADDALLLPEEDPDEIVEIIVELEAQPVSDALSLRSTSMAEAAGLQAVADAQAELRSAQASVQSSLNRALGAAQVEYTYSYTVLLNGFALRTARRNLDAIRAVPGVAKAYVAGHYQLPETQAAQSSLQAALSATGSEYTGEGTVIAILDTGLDITHSAFSNEPAGANFDKGYIRGLLRGAELNAERLRLNLTAEDVFVSSKIPFVFDYGMGDAGVAPIDKTQALALEHGTHVAGIAAGYDVSEEGQVLFSGVAPDAQIVFMKVFDDAGTGASTSAILAALEDACILGVDAVNLSLGVRSGFTVDEDETTNEVYKRLEAAGIMVVVAAGNDTSSSAYNSYGENLPLTADPDNSIVSSPSTYPSNLSVASVDGAHTYARYFLLGDEEIKFTDSLTTWLGLADFVKLIIDSGNLTGPIEEPYDYVMVPGYGDYADYNDIDVSGKIAVVQRGGTTAWGTDLTFANKMAYAVQNDAIGVIVYNNDAENPDDYGVMMDTGWYQIPACFVSYNVGQRLAELAGTGVGISVRTDYLLGENATAGQMSSFTSIGVTPDLRLKPEISAIGGNVYSAVPMLTQQGGYAVMSGTSMASPYVAGAGILVRQRITEDWSLMMTPAQAPQMTENLMMSTAQIVYDPATGLPYSPRQQGSGQLDLNAAMTSDVCLFTEADAYGDTKPVANLGDDVEKTGVYTISFYAQNLGIKAPVSYDIDVIAMAPDVLEREGYALMSDQDVPLDYSVSGQTSVELLPTAPKTEISLTLTLTEEQKTELDENFENGIFVEGFVRLTPSDPDTAPVLSLPFVAFYGDWSQPGTFDYATMLNDQEVSYSNYATAIGTWFSWLSVKLGANLSTNEAVSIKAEHLTISPNGDTMMDGVEIASLGLLRNAAAVRYTVTNEAGETLWTDETANVPRTSYYASSAAMVPATHFLDYAVEPWFGVDSEGNALPDGQYYYTIQAEPVTEHESANVRDTVTFPVYIDTAAPYLKAGTVSLRTNEEGRLILGLPVADDHILLSATVYQTRDNGEPNFYYEPLLQANYGLEGMEDIQYALAEVDVTDYAGQTVYLSLEDWGYNTSAYLIQVPETFTADPLTLSSERMFLFTGDTAALIGYNSMNEEELDLTWASSSESVATVDGAGVVTAVAPGVATITATTPSGVSATCIVGAEDALEFTGLRLDFDEMTIDVAFQSRIALPGVYLEPYGFQLAYADVNWTISDPSIARMVGDSAMWTNEVAGTITVTAEYQGMTASFDVNVFENKGSVTMYRRWITPTVNYIFTHDCADQLVVGYDAIYALDTAATSEDQILTFTNDHPEVASMDKTTTSATANQEMPNDGVFVTGMSPGTATITATATDTTQDSISWMITVIPKRYDGINVLNGSLSLCVDGTAQMTDTFELLGEHVMPEHNPVFYTSFDPSVVSVAEDGTLTAHQAGTGLIRAMLNTGDYVLISVEVSDHATEVREAADATCTGEGYTGDSYCTVCGELVTTGEVIPATGHSTELVDAKEPACTEEGYTGDEVCTVCGELVTTGEAIPATGHVTELIDAKAPTCTEDGYSGDEVCTVCGELVTTGEVIPAYCPSAAFEDVPLGEWYHDYVDCAVERGLMQGMSDTKFAPGGALTRAMMVTTLYRLAGGPEVELTDKFTDVADDQWYSKAVAWAAENNIVVGMTETTFEPSRDITREQAATILYRYMTVYLGLEPTEGADLSQFSDSAAISDYAADAMAWAVAEGLFEGFPNGTLQPKTTLTRAQMAKLLTILAQKF